MNAGKISVIVFIVVVVVVYSVSGGSGVVLAGIFSIGYQELARGHGERVTQSCKALQ